MKKTVLLIFLCIVLLICVMLVKTATFKSKQIEIQSEEGVEVNIEKAAASLSRAIQLKTISHQDPAEFDLSQFKALIHLLEKSFPKVHASLKKEIVGDASLLYTWKGNDSNLKPIILMAHTDVVPIAPGTTKDWTHPPFSGKIADGFIWGRGAVDYKVGVLGMLEAVEALLTEGFEPKRTVYLAFGHDEEVGGSRGAGAIAKLLKTRGVKAEWILDEGALIISGVIPGISNPVALLGLAEKGYVTLELSVETDGGHSSMPPKDTAIGILSSAIHNLERNQFPAKYEGLIMEMFEYAGPEMPFGMKLLFANKWLLTTVIKGQFQKVSSMNAMLRTTIAPTIINAGTKENVLPQRAKALVNFRLYPGDSIEYVIDHVTKSINDPRIKIEKTAHAGRAASPVTDIHTDNFSLLHKTVRQIFPDVIVTPFLVVGGTDTKHYVEISENIFRFLPLRFEKTDIKRVHGTNERIKIEHYEESVKFYAQMIKNAN
ncbi:MAG: M20 family peptidase [Deltaproteobacteria bacterium]|nr:M20 family peptidase [Deltaproteobacteria bacterium]